MNAWMKITFLYLSIALIGFIVAILLGGKTVFSLPKGNLNSPRIQNIIVPDNNSLTQKPENPPCVNQFQKDSSEIDGIGIAYLVNSISVMSPPRISNKIAKASVEIAIKNNRSEPIRFNRINFQPLFLKPDNTPFSMGLFHLGIIIPREEDYPLINPEESINLTWNMSFFWSENYFHFYFEDKYKRTWNDRDFKYDRFKVYFNYSFKEVSGFYLGSRPTPQEGSVSYLGSRRTLVPISELGEIWTGSFCTNHLEIKLID